MAHERRHLRARVRLPVSCEPEGGAQFPAVVTDISIGGCRIECAEAPAFGSTLTIVITLLGRTELSRLPATVRWTQSGKFGVQFGLLGARDTSLLAQLMSRGCALRLSVEA
jgi:type IV pilus assembly protein PilZ